MQVSPRERLMQFAQLLQSELFERLEEEVGPLGKTAKLLVAIAGMISLERFLPATYGWRGRPAKDRHALALAFIAKAAYGLTTTRQVRDRLQTDRQLRCLCGWREVRHIPHESTFSRAFAEFAQSELPDRLHAALIQNTQKDRLIGHIARDSTAIEARERYPDNRHRKRSARAIRKAQSLNAAQHLDVADGQIPITALISGASLHDSQVAVPLMNITCRKIRERTMVERVFARLKDEFGARSIRVRGAQKIMAHLMVSGLPAGACFASMFGVLALTVDQLLKLTG